MPNTFKAYGTDADGINVGDTQIVNITGIDNVNEWLKNKLSELQDFMKEYEVREIL